MVKYKNHVEIAGECVLLGCENIMTYEYKLKKLYSCVLEIKLAKKWDGFDVANGGDIGVCS